MADVLKTRPIADSQVQLCAPFGAKISGVSIADVDRDLAADVAALVVRHRVVVLKDQPDSDLAFVRFLGLMGPLMFTDGEIPVEGASDLNVVSNIGRKVPPRSVFHTDTSYVAQPPAFSALRAVCLPDRGGETLFSDQVRAASELPGHVRDWIGDRRVSHEATDPAGNVHKVSHPLLRANPDTGETALYLSTPARCTGLTGVEANESRRIIDVLYRRSIRPAHLYRHRWQRGDFVIWDNRTTMHRADHGNVAGDRVLHRGMVRGEVPVAAGTR